MLKMLISFCAVICLASCGGARENQGCYYSVSLLSFGGATYESLGELKDAFDRENARYVFDSEIHGEYLLVRADCKDSSEYVSGLEGIVVSILSSAQYNTLRE